jgi:hypothetical protein
MEKAVETGRKYPEQELALISKEYNDLKSLIDKYQTRLDQLKKELNQQADLFGDEDDKGHKWLRAGSFQIKRERRVSVNLDTSGAEAWAKDNNIWDDVSEVVRVLDEDKLLGKVWENPELKPALDNLYVKKETWAFKLSESKSYDDE